MKNILNDRRDFLKFMGRNTLFWGMAPWLTELIGCSNAAQPKLPPPFATVEHNTLDQLTLAQGLQSEILIKWNEPINSHEFFGVHNDFLAFQPFQGKIDEGILLVNHEYFQPPSFFIVKNGWPTP